MKIKPIILLMLYAFTFICLSSCLKKGEDDPSISFRSRKARVVGNWKIKSGTRILTGDYYTEKNELYNNSTTNYTENTFNIRAVGPNFLHESSGSFSYKIEFKKDGDFVSTIVYDNSLTVTLNGTWNFTGKVGNHKNKEQIVIHFKSQSNLTTNPSSTSNTSFEGNQQDQTYYIKELRNDKIVLVSEFTTIDLSGKPRTEDEDLTFIQN